MPPSREFTFELNEDVKKRLEEALRLKAPVRVKVTNQRSGSIYGRHNSAARLITVNLGMEVYTNSSLVAIQTEVLKTLLHEYRHAHQHDNWDEKRIARDKRRPYHAQEMEQDAERFAEQGVREWGALGRVKPKGVVSRLSRLSAAERNVR